MRVIIESPYAGEIEENVKYAREALRDSLSLGEFPFASHLLYTQPGVLQDEDPAERQQGIDAGFAWLKVAQLSAIYIDRGISRGMQGGIVAALTNGIPIEFRSLQYHTRRVPNLVPLAPYQMSPQRVGDSFLDRDGKMWILNSNGPAEFIPANLHRDLR